ISQARLAQGKLLTKMAPLGLKLNREAQADILIEEALQTSAIEGESLNRESVRSSVARHLKLPTAGLLPPDRRVDGLVEVLLDATQNYAKPLTGTRLKRWQAALFPTGQSGLHKIQAGAWRNFNEAMQVISERKGRSIIHFEAPPGKRIPKEMEQFFAWWKSSLGNEDGLLRSGLAHFYFVTIHPFEDGNGRIARALTDMALAEDEKLPIRYYSLSSQIMEERSAYYKILETSQKGSTDVTEWLQWYLGCYTRAVAKAETLIGGVLAKAGFWQHFHSSEMNERQRKVINRLLEAGKGEFQGGLTTRKYVALTKTSRATAFREISDLLEKGILRQNRAQGRSVSYDLHWPD
ncbi:MAG: Fic family protein, partial [Deltaproteobacteria bacterium]|nr:Fic family protein [Deltaproteobacteria bacterium]